MKRQLINFLLLAMIFVAGCKKESDRYPSAIALKRVPYVNVKIDASGSQAIDLLNLANFSGKYTISLLYTDDAPPSKVDVVVIKNGNKSNVKVLQASVGTFPSSFTLTAAQLASLFGAPVALGDNYDIGVDIYTADGAKYEAFPAATSVTSYGGTGQANQPNFTPTARFSAICAYDPNIYQGNFKAADAFGDADGSIIVLTKIDNTHFSFIYPSVLNPVPIVVTVTTTNNNAAILGPQTIGTQWSAAYGYPNTATYANPSAVTATSGGGSVSPCAGVVTLKISWGVQGGAAVFGGGPYTLTLTKQ